jgi:hypothetical protein
LRPLEIIEDKNEDEYLLQGVDVNEKEHLV